MDADAGQQIGMAELVARMQAMEDRHAITELIARYGFLADRWDVAGVAALWTEDGIYDVCGYGVHRGTAAITALLERQFRQTIQARVAAHIISAPMITLEGDTARVTTLSCWLRRGGAGWEAYYLATDEWQLARTPAGWRVATRCNRPVDDRPAVQAHTAGYGALRLV